MSLNVAIVTRISFVPKISSTSESTVIRAACYWRRQMETHFPLLAGLSFVVIEVRGALGHLDLVALEVVDGELIGNIRVGDRLSPVLQAPGP